MTVSKVRFRLKQNMPLRQEIQFLRERAQRLCDIAASHPTALSVQLREMAQELRARADEIEAETRNDDGGC